MTDTKKILQDLRKIGIDKGGTVYLRVRKSAIGTIDEADPIAFLDILLGYLGSQGNLVMPAFTQIGSITRKPKALQRDSSTYAGAMPKRLIADPNALRSEHPSHSFIGLGPDVRRYFEGHGPHTPCFLPVQRMIEDNAKMLLIGCIETSPGFSTVHVVQNELGLTKKHLMRFAKRYLDHTEAGRNRLCIPEEFPGCSRGFSNLYKDYLAAGVLSVGQIGQAPSLAIDMQDAYEIEKGRISDDPRYPLCSDPACLSCACMNAYNLRAMPGGILRVVSRAVGKRLPSLPSQKTNRA